VRNAKAAIELGDVDSAREVTLQAVSDLDKAAEKGILHKNNAARRKSRLMKRLASLEKQNA
jgi:small subunit ribosomal protein S20